MNLRKTAASLTALMCSAGALSVFPASVGNVGAADVVFNDFEANYDGWHGSDTSVELTAADGIGFGGSRGMAVTNRTDSSEGAESTKGLYLMGGIKYNYSVSVKSDKAETFTLSMLCIDMKTGAETTVILDEKQADAGEWITLEADYKAPQNASEFRLSITTDSTDDFVFDNCVITEPISGMTAKAAVAGKGLKDEFANYFRVGNILNSGWGGGTVTNSAITANILKDCNAIECENETKPDATLVQNGSSNTNIKVSLSSCAAICDFCITNGLSFRGHTMIWHSQTPQWFFKDNFQDGGNWVSTSVMDQRMESYIKNMFAAFASQYPDLNLYAYDVCNECVSDDSNRTKNNGGARTPGYGNGNSPWVQIYGSNIFVEKAFTYADKYAPDTCKLFYNDYNEYWDHKRDCIYNMCKSLYEKGVLDGVGMQSHINADMNGFSGIDAYTTAMKKYLSIGCDVQITELDVTLLDNNQVKYTTDQQAAKYKAVFQAAKDWNDNPESDGRVTLVQIWGPNDANSWLGNDAKGLVYDSNNQPKSAYNSITSIVPDSEWGDGKNYQGGVEPAPVEPDENGYFYHSTFESGVDGWSGRSADVEQSGSEHYAGSGSLYVSGRTSEWQGATYSISARAFKPGETYSFSADVMYPSGDASAEFFMKLQYVDSSGETQYDEIAAGTLNKGEWSQLANTAYTIPSDASQMQVYIETAESLTDFYVDEAMGGIKGATIDGPGPAKTVSAGDVNFDGVVDIFDVASAKRILTGKNNDSLAKRAADVDNSGEVDVADIIQLQSFALRRITEFTLVERPEPETMSMAEFTELVSKNVVNVEPNDSHNEKSGVQYGTVKADSYYSTTCNRTKKVNVLLPAGYSESKQYPVLYVLHGYYENQDRMIIYGNNTMYTRQIIGNAIASGEAKDMIVVFPDVFSSATLASCTGMNDTNNAAYDNFINDLTKDLMPYIEKNYSILTGRDNTAITGFSMGGRESLLIGMQRPDLFGYVGAICPAPGVTGSFNWKSGEEPHILFLTAGTNDEVVYSTPSGYNDSFTKNNVPHIWHYVQGGYHGDNSIHAHLYNFVRCVFQA